MHRNFGLFLIFGSSFYCVSGCVSFFSFSFYFAFPCGSHTFFFSIMQWLGYVEWNMLYEVKITRNKIGINIHEMILNFNWSDFFSFSLFYFYFSKNNPEVKIAAGLWNNCIYRHFFFSCHSWKPTKSHL